MPQHDDAPLQLSVLDRLLDDNPTAEHDPQKSRARSHQELLDAVRRDLEALLNTRACSIEWGAALTQLDNSILNYGIEMVGSTVYSVETNRELFRAAVERTIRRFEPRFLQVSVELIDDQEKLDRTIRFRVHAHIDTKPAPEPLVFDSTLDPSTRGISVAAPRNV